MKLIPPIKYKGELWNGLPPPFTNASRMIGKSQGFGGNPSMYKPLGIKGHNGLDFGMPIGTELVAPCDMVITRVKFDTFAKSYGYHIFAQGGGYEIVMAHMSDIVAVIGNAYKQGDTIGYSGNTGYSTGPHLHFGLRPLNYNASNGYNGWINPEPFFEPAVSWTFREIYIMKEIDGRLTFNNKTGEINYCYDGKLLQATPERFPLMLASYLVRKEGVNIDSAIWDKMAKKDF